MFDVLKELPGYAPFDNFLEKWSRLDPAIYPYGGQANISSNEGLAYSCMMVMAHGFNRTIYNSSIAANSSTEILTKLALGQLGQYLTPSTFNTSFIGPEGPVIFDQNGDMASGNFRLYNIQNGSQVEIAKIIAGNMNITSSPIYHDGTAKVPTGVPDRVILNPGYSSPVTITLMAISSLGTLLALLTMVLVLVYRKREVFKASSPLFCVLELMGFILAYISLYFFVGYRTKFSCTIIPISFHLGYSLILGNLIAKNYRIYRIFNNIFITRTVVTDVQLLKVSGSIVAANAIVLIAWFSSSTVSTVNIPVSRDSFYVDCAFEGVNHSVFVSLLTLLGSLQLGFATFLAFKTRSVGRNYSKYSEYKQIGLSVYNIFFSVLIGFIIFFIPTTDYFTRHYLTATMIVWATTFSLLTLFLPKLHAFFLPEEESPEEALRKASDLSGRQRLNRRTNTIGVKALSSPDGSILEKYSDEDDEQLPPIFDFDNQSDMMSLNYMVNNSQHPFNNSTVKLSNISGNGRMHGIMMEVHEAQVPVQYVFKYFPYLAAWEMMQIVLMPGITYFSFFSEKSNKGKVFPYSGSSIASNKCGEYTLKIHGLGMFDVLMQVESEKDLMQWNSWFNSRHDNDDNVRTSNYYPNDTLTNSPFEKISGLISSEKLHTMNDDRSNSKHNTKGTIDSAKDRVTSGVKNLGRQTRLDSGVTTRRLLESDEDNDEDGDRRGSETTVGTLDSCYNHPVVMVSDYGVDQINHARAVQQQVQLQRNHEESQIQYSPSMVLGSITDEERTHTSQLNDSRVSFYSSFADYLSSSGISNLGGETIGSDNTLATLTESHSLTDIVEEGYGDRSANNN